MKKITTQVLGEQTRFDQRESIFPRTAAGLEKDRGQGPARRVHLR